MDKGVHTFPKGICPKVNVIARLEYELAYYDSVVHRFNHYTTRTPPTCDEEGLMFKNRYILKEYLMLEQTKRMMLANNSNNKFKHPQKTRFFFIVVYFIPSDLIPLSYTGWNDKTVTLEKTTWFHFRLMKTGFPSFFFFLLLL